MTTPTVIETRRSGKGNRHDLLPLPDLTVPDLRSLADLATV